MRRVRPADEHIFGSITIDICGPASCGQQSDCAEDSFCQISLDFSGAPFLIGLCLPPDEGQTAELGDACNADGSNVAAAAAVVVHGR